MGSEACGCSTRQLSAARRRAIPQAEVIESDKARAGRLSSELPGADRAASLARVLEEIASEREDLRIVKLNVDENSRETVEVELTPVLA